MKKNISKLLGIIMLSMVLFAGVNTALAAPVEPDPDPLFFVLKVNAKGYDLLDGEESRAFLRTTLYMMYVWNGYFLAYETSTGWELSDKVFVFPYDTDKAISIFRHETEFLTPDGHYFLNINARIPFKAKDGDVVRAVFKSVGAAVYGSTCVSQFYGNGSIKGKMVPFEKLPAEVQAVIIF